MMNQKTETKKNSVGLTRSIYDFVDKDIDLNSNDFVNNKTEDADSDPFLYSLENLTPDDIAEGVIKKKSTYDIIYGIVRYILLLICAGVFVYSAYQLGVSAWGYIISQRITDEFSGFMDFADDSVFDGEYTYSGILQLSPKVTKSIASPNYETSLVATTTTYDITADKLTVNVYNQNLEYKKAQMANLAQQYADTFAYIKILNTRIDYAVMQAGDNDFYLKHTMSGSYLPAGSIFADYRNDPNLIKNFNTIFYGHNMKNGTMFADVTKYLNEEFFMENPNIEVYTTNGIYTYEVFSIYQARMDDDYIRTAFPNYEEFVEFAEKIEARSLHSRGDIEFKDNDHILTLSTCTNGFWQDRYALHARLIKFEK